MTWLWWLLVFWWAPMLLILVGVAYLVQFVSWVKYGPLLRGKRTTK